MGFPSHIVGRYAAYEELASGGMASVHYGLLSAGSGFSRRVAIKRMHPQFAKDAGFSSMFLDEARMAARIQHPNVVQTLDVVAADGELFIVLEYVHGESLAKLVAASKDRAEPIPVAVANAIAIGMLRGLDAAHRAKSELGEPLGIVHRDVSPQNVIVGADGLARILDFGVAKARGNMRATPLGEVKGKLAYIAPEQLSGKGVGREADIYSAGVVLWEILAGRRLFRATTEAEAVSLVLRGQIEPLTALRSEVSHELDAIVARALARDPARRFVTAEEMASAIERVGPVAAISAVSAWVRERAGARLDEQERVFTAIERAAAQGVTPASLPALAATPSAEREHTASPVTGASRPRARSGVRSVLNLVVIALALGTLGFWVFWSLRPAPVTPAVAAPSAPPPPVSVATAAPSAPAASAETPDAASSADVRPVAPPRRSPPPTRSQAAPKTSCNPPYYVDARGIQHVKPECL